MKKLTIVFLSVISFYANAQKLPNVQQAGVRAPANIKMDGKAIEWDNKFQAYNKSIDAFYTISNDDDHLYLTIQATDPDIITKMMGGGVTFIIQKTGKKNDKDAISITYPAFDKKDRPYFNLKDLQDKPVSVKDSVITAYNKTFLIKSKLINVTGVPGTDTLISIYNQDGIKAAGLFDNKLAYTYELAVDLKQLDLSLNDPAKFAYHINLGSSISKSLMSMMSLQVGADGSVSHDGTNPAIASTDFWGEYMLAKK